MNRKQLLFLLSIVDRKINSFWDQELRIDSVSITELEEAKNIIINELVNDTTMDNTTKPRDIQE